MLHSVLDGLQFPTALPFLVRIEPYDSQTELILASPQTIGAANVQLWGAASNVTAYFFMRNISTGGQAIGFRHAAMATIADAESILYPGETSPVFINMSTAGHVIADAAGGVLAFFYYDTNPF